MRIPSSVIWTKPAYEGMSDFSEGMSAVSNGGKFGYVVNPLKNKSLLMGEEPPISDFLEAGGSFLFGNETNGFPGILSVEI
ncbi:hypothetical protein ACFPVX_03425 [Cohnella faecalis]|uniref:hypothetical protein n=1 Tax=Cohnella faecalis TaxID=2315694 RepID=UPI00360BAA36